MTRPEVTLLIAAYNERDILLEKVHNSLMLDYPSSLLKIVFVTDGSTDDSAAFLKSISPSIVVHHSDQRAGKRAAIERVMPLVQSPIVILTDANCMLNPKAVENIVRHYEDPTVGAVAGEKKVLAIGSGAGEGLYWKYESWLKKADSEFYSVVGAAGELFSFRRELFQELPSDTIIEDFVLSLTINQRGFRVVYEPEAIAMEAPSANVAEEWKRKVRICAGGFQALGRFSSLLNPFNRVGYLLISHRALRWAVVPFLLPLIFVLPFLLKDDILFGLLFVVQCLFYAIAAVGLLYLRKRDMPKLISIPFQFVVMNAAAYAGLWRLLQKRQSAVWEKSARMAA